MTDLEPMPIEVLAGLVPLVKSRSKKDEGTPGWPSKGSVVLLIGAQVGGGWFTGEEVAEYLPRAGGTCRRLLGELEDERVILRDAGLGGEQSGGRGGMRYWCEVEPDWERWRVVWRYPRRVIRQKVALLREQAEKSDYDRFIARSYSARYPKSFARSWVRETVRREAAEAALSRIHRTSDNGSGGGVFRAKWGGKRRSGTLESLALERAKTGGRPQERVLTGGDDEDLSPVRGPAPPKRESGISVQREHIAAAKRAVCARAAPGRGTKKPVIFARSSLEERVVELLADHGVDAFIAACAEIEADEYAPPTFVELVADLLATGELPHDVDEASRDPRTRAQLEHERKQLEVRIATYENEGIPVPDKELGDHAKIAALLDDQDQQMEATT